MNSTGKTPGEITPEEYEVILQSMIMSMQELNCSLHAHCMTPAGQQAIW